MPGPLGGGMWFALKLGTDMVQSRQITVSPGERVTVHVPGSVASSPSVAPSQCDYPSTERTEGAALVRVLVPADAELWFNGTKTTQGGTAREFESPPLAPGKK